MRVTGAWVGSSVWARVALLKSREPHLLGNKTCYVFSTVGIWHGIFGPGMGKAAMAKTRRISKCCRKCR